MWKSVSQLKEHNWEAEQFDIALSDSDGEIQSPHPGIMEITTLKLREERYRAPREPPYPSIPIRLWGLSQEAGKRRYSLRSPNSGNSQVIYNTLGMTSE